MTCRHVEGDGESVQFPEIAYTPDGRAKSLRLAILATLPPTNDGQG